VSECNLLLRNSLFSGENFKEPIAIHGTTGGYKIRVLLSTDLAAH